MGLVVSGYPQDCVDDYDNRYDRQDHVGEWDNFGLDHPLGKAIPASFGEI
jgi:hypothetical protein